MLVSCKQKSKSLCDFYDLIFISFKKNKSLIVVQWLTVSFRGIYYSKFDSDLVTDICRLVGI